MEELETSCRRLQARFLKKRQANAQKRKWTGSRGPEILALHSDYSQISQSHTELLYHSRGNLTNQVRILQISKYKTLLLDKGYLTELLISNSIYIGTGVFKGCQCFCAPRDGVWNRSDA